MQTIAVEKDFSEITEEKPESNKLFGKTFSNGKSSNERKNIFSKQRLAKEYEFDPKYVYTFDFYQHVVIPSNYGLDIGIAKVDLAKSLNGQPIQVKFSHIDSKESAPFIS